jgi:hypothetical protein
MAINTTSNATTTSAPVNFLRPNRADELLQGFLNIDGNQSNVANTRLTQQELTAYGQKQFFAADPNSNVFGYLRDNFAAISKLDGDATSISANDLVQLKQGLPTPPANPPASNYTGDPRVLSLFSQLLQMMIALLTSLKHQ